VVLECTRLGSGTRAPLSVWRTDAGLVRLAGAVRSLPCAS